jgi:tetratricopeptide (TPR) repeat protein
MKRPGLLLLLLVVVAFSLSTWLQPRLPKASGGRDSDNVFKVLFGEGRRIFANHFAVKADIYLHSGFYPSIFDQAAKAKETEEAELEPGHVHTAECNHDPHNDDHVEHHEESDTTANGHKCDTSFMGEPRDWIERLGRKFMVSEHSHLENGREREILPWLKLSAQLDPQRVETYLVAGYWLSERLGKPKDAEEFLRDGLRANPQSYEILFELGHIYEHSYKEPDRARNVWRLALKRWNELEPAKEKPDNNGRNLILGQLAELELKQGHLQESIRYFEEAKKYSPSPEAIDARIKEIWLRYTLPDAGGAPAASPAH